MLDIIVPVFNESDNILKLFSEIEKEIRISKRIMIVYDFDEDTTIPVVVQHQNDYSFQIVLLKNNLGRGVLNAIKVGISSAYNEMVLVMMADLSDKLDVVDEMCQKMTDGFDLVCGSRYVKGGEQNGGPLLKGIFSRVAGISLHILTRIPTHDVTNSFKLYRKSMLDSFDIESTGGFEIGIEITVKAYVNGYKITEVPSRWFDREAGKSNFHMWKWLPKYLHWYLWCIRRCWFGKRNSYK